MLLLSGSANRPLAEELAAHLGQPLCQVTLRRFADGELFVKIDENVRGRDVYIIQPTNPPAENMMELLLLMDAAKRASAARVTAVPSSGLPGASQGSGLGTPFALVLEVDEAV
jgi:ribose-phosphate pyrophosphokinase